MIILMSTHKSEAILMSTHNICFYGEITKIISKLASNTLLICSTGTYKWAETWTPIYEPHHEKTCF